MDADLPFFAVPFVGGSATAFPTLFTGLDSSFCLVGLYGCFCLTGGLLVALSLNLEACGAFFFQIYSPKAVSWYHYCSSPKKKGRGYEWMIYRMNLHEAYF